MFYIQISVEDLAQEPDSGNINLFILAYTPLYAC